MAGDGWRCPMSTLTQELDCYLAIRRGLGYDLTTAERILRRFAAFADARKARYLTTEALTPDEEGLLLHRME
jgi:hypothetical protein